MTTLREAAQQALNALDRVQPQIRGAIPQQDVEDAIDTLRAALAEPVDETTLDVSGATCFSPEPAKWGATAMTRDDIIRMAYEASDGVLSYDAEGRWILSEQEVIRLTALVAAAEREACAKVAESYEPTCDTCPSGVANAIRARGEA